MKIKSNLRAVTFLTGLAIASSASAGEVTTGEFVLDFDESGLFSLSSQIENTAWFDAVESADKSTAELMGKTDVPDSFDFKVFGSSIPTPPVGLAGRFPKASTFDYQGAPNTGTGYIGLAGLHSISTVGGAVLFGDYTLSYDLSRVDNAAGGSGWFLTNHNTFSLIAFDLTNVETTVIDENNFALSGDVVIAKDLGFMLQSPGDEGVDIGNFTFTTLADPDAYVDGTIAHYSFGTERLTLPSIMANNMHYKATFRKLTLDDGRFALELKSTEPTSLMPETHAMYDMSTGVMTMPEIVLLEAGESTNDKVKVMMKLEEGYFPMRFILTNVENIEK